MRSFAVKCGNFRLTLAAVFAWAALLPAAARAADWKFSSSVNFDTGKYGTSERTNSVYVPFTLKRYYENSDLSVTVPYLRQSAMGQVTWVGGSPVRLFPRFRTAVTARQAGLGDIMLRGTRTLLREEPDAFDLALAGKVKLPTADEAKGLGTGRLDAGAGLEYAKLVSPGWTFLADGYYTFIGEPEGADFNDQLSVDMGFYRQLREGLALTVLLEGQNAIVDGNDGPRSLSGTLSYRASDGVQFFGGLTLGLSDGSPAFGVSLGFSGRF